MDPSKPTLLRGLRAERIVEYFKEYKAIYDPQQLLPHERLVKPAWKPPKPTLQECMTHLCKLIQGKFTTSEFRAGITECFRSMGLCPDDRGTFAEFKFTSDAGTLPIAPAGTVTAYPRQANDMTQEEYLDS